ncbi:hypothetical protein [Leifsonia sp. Root112D2]|jgi:hypothetical protein|uniref:hypothetical protein n=1 Tax=Leifsonia sp. Root112D2 TaxID=1736426 RepID=UPI0006F51E5B|nr:hypothetical protein [Leifsonia sp. Root112D2]KQV05154.1 hypothetical protein ASC63_15295 [Leifsonia sp. Root112D2]
MADNENLNEDVTADADHTDAGENTQRDKNLGALADDVAHPFDQTNGIVEGLEGDADDPEKQDDGFKGTGVIATPAAGGGPAGGIPIVTPVHDEPDPDTDEPQGA